VRILRGHADAVRCLAYAPDGARLASGSDDGTVRLWDLAGGGEVLTLSDSRQTGVEVLAFVPGGQGLVAGTGNGSLLRWDLGTRRTDLVWAHIGGVRCLAWDPDGKTLATAGWDGRVRLWNGRTLRSVGELEVGPPATAALTFPPGRGLLVLGGDDGTLRLADPARRRVTASFPGRSPLPRLACSPDGRLLAVGDRAGVIRLWDLDAGEERAVLRGHTWTVYGLIFSPDGTLLLSGGADGTVCLWDVAARRARGNFRWHTRWVTCVAFAPDGMTAAAGSEDHTIVVWDVDT
jgi:WD40 repeat protein